MLGVPSMSQGPSVSCSMVSSAAKEVGVTFGVPDATSDGAYVRVHGSSCVCEKGPIVQPCPSSPTKSPSSSDTIRPTN